jgi:hypothetical protein
MYRTICGHASLGAVFSRTTYRILSHANVDIPVDAAPQTAPRFQTLVPDEVIIGKGKAETEQSKER